MSVEAPTKKPSEVTRSWMTSLPPVALPGTQTNQGQSNQQQPAGTQPPDAQSTEGGGGEGAATPPPDPKAGQAPPAAKPGPEAGKQTSADVGAGDGAERWPRNAQEWKEFRTKRDEGFAARDKRIKELEEQAAAAAGKVDDRPAIDPKDFETLKSERDQLSERLKVVAVTQHPQFQAYFKRKVDEQFSLAKRIVGEEHAAVIEQILNIQDPESRLGRLEEFSDNLPRIKQNQLAAVLNNLDSIDAEKQQEISRATQTYEELQAKESKAGESHRAGLEKVFNDTVTKFQGKDGVAMFMLRDGDEAWNSDVKARIESAKALLFSRNQNPETLVNAALNAMAYQPLLNALKSLTSANSKLNAQIQELTKANPTIEPGRTDGGEPGSKPTMKPGMRPMETTNTWIKGLPPLGQ